MSWSGCRIFSLLALAAGAGYAGGEARFGKTAALAFEENRGQWAAEASFGTHAEGFSASFHNTEVTYALAGSRVTTRWLGSATRPLRAVERLPGVANYYVGSDASRWISGLATYRRLRAEAIYPGIDLVYYGEGQQLEYDLIVGPGADVGRVTLGFAGGKLRLDERGDLVVETASGRFVQHRPVAYQELVAGVRTAVEARYVIGRRGEVRFALGRYDRGRELVIDPTIAWAQTLGSGTQGHGEATGLATDSSGNVFVTGTQGPLTCQQSMLTKPRSVRRRIRMRL